MAVWQKEPGACIGRGFDSAGFMGKLYSWITRAPSTNVIAPFGGPAWYIWDDQSSASPNPYIVICNVASPTPNASRAKFIQIVNDSVFPGRVHINHWFYWNNTTHLGIGLWFRSNLGSIDAGPFAYDFRGGADGMQFGSLIASNYCFSMIMDWDAITNFCEASNIIGTLQSAFFRETDVGGYLSGYSNVTGVLHGVNTDASGFLYFSIVLVSGTTYKINIYKDSARTLLVGHTSNFTNTAVGIPYNIFPDNSSNLGGTITLDITAVAVTNISCGYFWITLASGEGALFTVGNWYFMTDFSQGQAWITYCKVLEKSGDNIRVDSYYAGRNFSATSLFGAYPHRWVTLSNRYYNSGTAASANAGSQIAKIPYFSNPGNESNAIDGISDQAAGFDFMQNTLTYTAPGDDLNYAGQRPVIYESQHQDFGGVGNRTYGKMRACYITSTNGIGIYLSGRNKDGIDYLFIATVGGLAFLVQDTVFAS